MRCLRPKWTFSHKLAVAGYFLSLLVLPAVAVLHAPMVVVSFAWAVFGIFSIFCAVEKNKYQQELSLFYLAVAIVISESPTVK